MGCQRLPGAAHGAHNARMVGSTGATAEAGYLNLIAEMVEAFAESQDIDETLRCGIERMAEVVDAEAASLFLVDEDTSEIRCHTCIGPVDITGMQMRLGEGIVGRTIHANASEMVRDVRADPDFHASVDAATGFTTRSMVCSPLTVANRCLGAVQVINRRSGDGLFTAADARLLDVLARSAALALLNARLASQMVARERVQRELELAADIQRRLLPDPNATPSCAQGINLPARQVSGDFFDVVVLADGRIAFNVGDVSGKGMDAALVMAKTSSLFRALVRDAPEPGALLGRLNDELVSTAARGLFVTMVAGIYDPAARSVILANAGHEPPLRHDRARDWLNGLDARAPPLGIGPSLDGADGWPEDEIQLDGDALYVFSDGLTEAPVEDGHMLGTDGVAELIRRHAAVAPAKRVTAIAERVRQPGISLHDDVTLLVIEDGCIGSTA